jgi:hypothetical protein
MVCSRWRKAVSILVVVAIIATVMVACANPVSPPAKVLRPSPRQTPPVPICYRFYYYASYVEGGIYTTPDSEPLTRGGWGLQKVWGVGGRFLLRNPDGPTQAWFYSVKPICWCPPVPANTQPAPTDLLVYEYSDSLPPGNDCFPPADKYYGRITLKDQFLGKDDAPTNFQDGQLYYITTCAFCTQSSNQPIEPPAFGINYSWSEKKAVKGYATASIFDQKKKIANIPSIFPGGAGCVKEFYVIYNQTICSDGDEDGIINVPAGFGFSVWIENDQGQRGRICCSTIYAGNRVNK